MAVPHKKSKVVMIKKIFRASLLAIVFFLTGKEILAQDVSSDRYASAPAAPVKSSDFKKTLLRLPATPFELLRWPIDKGLNYVEKHQLDKKTLWVYNKIQEYGLSPDLSVVSINSYGGGTELDLIRLTRQQERFPDVVAKGWVHYDNSVYFKTGAQAGLDRIANTGFYSLGLFDYEYRPQEHFYGIGPHASAGEGSVYAMETTTWGFSGGYKPSPIYDLNANFAFRDIDISGGRDGSRGRIGEGIAFSPDKVSGINGDRILTLGTEFKRDTRNAEENSTSGGNQRVGFSFNNGTGSSHARYLRYEVEAAQYIPLWSPRRVLVLHAYGEHNNEIGGERYIPFYLMPKLGDDGTYPRLSHTLRGFDFNRFTDDSALLLNLEYRYTIWEYQNFKADTIVFWDEGQVFGKIGSFQFKNFRDSYGLGFRVSMAKVTLFSIAVAHGDEGTHFYVKTGSAF